MLSELHEDVIDLTDALDDEPSPVFYDATHTNERGARVVAEAIYGHIEDDLRARPEGEGP
jgi:hypothetical protein